MISIVRKRRTANRGDGVGGGPARAGRTRARRATLPRYYLINSRPHFVNTIIIIVYRNPTNPPVLDSIKIVIHQLRTIRGRGAAPFLPCKKNIFIVVQHTVCRLAEILNQKIFISRYGKLRTLTTALIARRVYTGRRNHFFPPPPPTHPLIYTDSVRVSSTFRLRGRQTPSA